MTIILLVWSSKMALLKPILNFQSTTKNFSISSEKSGTKEEIEKFYFQSNAPVD